MTPSSDKNSLSIFIRDTGLGFSFDELTKKFTEDALHKVKEGKELSFIEECLIDEALRDEIPPKAIARLLCNRGASTGEGTGIGLSLAKDIIEEGHQGAIRLYNHPTMGAGVQILLPQVDRALSPEDRKQITRRSLNHQIENGITGVGVC